METSAEDMSEEQLQAKIAQLEAALKCKRPPRPSDNKSGRKWRGVGGGSVNRCGLHEGCSFFPELWSQKKLEFVCGGAKTRSKGASQCGNK